MSKKWGEQFLPYPHSIKCIRQWGVGGVGGDESGQGILPFSELLIPSWSKYTHL